MLAQDRKKTSGYRGLLQLVQYARPYQWQFLGAFLILLLATSLEMLSPWIMKIILDEHIAPGVNDDVMGLAMMGSALLGTYLGASILQYIQNVQFQNSALKVIHDIRRMVFAHTLKLPMRYFDSEPTGRLVSRITNDSEVLRQMFVGVIPSILQAFFRVVGIFIAMSLLDVRLMLMTASLIPVLLLSIHLYQKISHPVVHGVRSQLANINTRLNESLSGIRIVQAMGQEAWLQNQFDKDNKEWSDLKRKNINIDSVLLMPLTNLLGGIALAVVVGWFGYQSGFSVVEIGTLYAFINYLNRFFEPFKQITMQMSSLQQSLVASERLFQVLNEETDSNQHQPSEAVKINNGKLEFKNVSLSYDSKNQALDDVSFTVDPGQFIAIVGHSGSGKSSVINLLMRFYQHQQGEILIDNQPLTNLSEEELRQGLGLVFQEPYIFSGTMAENISLNHQQITHDDVLVAARKVHADRFISNLSDGYEHKPGPGGKALSTGERQLLSFARTIAQNPKILLLDEATANIDGETEHHIKEALITLRENRTTIAVAHRLSTIQDADQILVMDKGQIVQRGTHEALLGQDGQYRNLYLAQQAEDQLGTHLEEDPLPIVA
ncbi:ABC transporter ATP-binding protein [Endozoicomonas ascidiicola]|uniref:ABC transporter ATP-binding protein n=1 Tax=Endozoicomonas ascidiicola TaxID=1698521 RepID=UPI00082FFA2C|nr:ABC transporter ATP-binding protein [Endozoicomonas ascidiicola]